jgi:hypothetical protein
LIFILGVPLRNDPTELGEAIVQFELYRFLKNIISSQPKFEETSYIDVVPEAPVGGRAADLLIKANLDGHPADFLVIEVKRRTKDGLIVFDSSTRDQTREYANALSAVYYAITDGERLRLFRTLNDNLIGNYSFCLDESAVKQFLKGLSELHQGRISQLQFNIVVDPSAKIEELTIGFSRLLLDLFNEVSGKGTIVVAQRGKMKWLNIGVHKGILRLELSEETSKTSIAVQLEVLKKALGLEKSAELMKKLSEIPGFQWVRDRIDFNKPFIWILIKDVAIEEPDRTQAYEGLRKWILELNEVLK